MVIRSTTFDRPAGVSDQQQRGIVQGVSELDRMRNQLVRDPEIATRIRQYELAFRMQASVPDLMDFSDESADTLKMYGTEGADGSYASNCLHSLADLSNAVSASFNFIIEVGIIMGILSAT